MEEFARLIAESQAAWPAQVVAAILGTDEPAAVAERLEQAITQALGVPVAAARFYEPGVGIVAGVELADGRSVVAKVHRSMLVSRRQLAAIAHVQAALARAGQPAPSPLAGPLELGDGWLTVEELRDGDRADGYDPAVRRAMATALHGFVQAARSHADVAGLGPWPDEPMVDDLWPVPHDLRFDLLGTAGGAAWIDDAGRRARHTLVTAELPRVVGHLDWRVQNLAFSDSLVTAIYDWDSIRVLPEAALVGSTSVLHPVDWRLGLPDPLPSLAQVDGFVADYEAARGAPFAAHERGVLRAGQRWTASYGARCQHSDERLRLFPEIDHSRGWPRLLRELLR